MTAKELREKARDVIAAAMDSDMGERSAKAALAIDVLRLPLTLNGASEEKD